MPSYRQRMGYQNSEEKEANFLNKEDGIEDNDYHVTTHSIRGVPSGPTDFYTDPYN